MVASVFCSAARKAACLSVTEWAFNVRASTFFPLGLWEMGSMPPTEEQPCETQKQRGMILVKEWEKRIVVNQNTWAEGEGRKE